MYARCAFCVAQILSFPSNASPEWMMSTIALGRAASRSFSNARACPRYASGEYMHSVEKYSNFLKYAYLWPVELSRVNGRGEGDGHM